jgi:hypothetical protein
VGCGARHCRGTISKNVTLKRYDGGNWTFQLEITLPMIRAPKDITSETRVSCQAQVHDGATSTPGAKNSIRHQRASDGAAQLERYINLAPYESDAVTARNR